MYGISRNLLVMESEHSLCFLSPQPVLPGHLIILPKRTVAQLSELRPEESLDLWSVVQRMGTHLKSHYTSPSLTIEFKHQAYPNLFLNLIPRKQNDLASNDLIYPMLEPSLSTFENPSLIPSVDSLKLSLSS